MREVTEQERALLKALAPTVLRDRAARAMVVGADKKGRTIVELMGEPTEAEQAWDKARAEIATDIRRTS